MKQSISDFIVRKNKRALLDVDLHDVVALNEMGFKDTEIADELGIPRMYVGQIMKGLEKDY